jgi:putative thiamine transport system ATP-binding protein
MSLELDRVQVRYRDRILFLPVTLSISQGEIATVMGPSGCGKSTLLAAIAGNLEHGFKLDGRIILNGRELNGTAMEKRRVGILFQDDLLFPHFDVYGNLAFGLSAGLKREAKEQRIMEALEQAGLEDFARRDVATLSGGQKARVSLLRTLLAEPETVLLDEPFSKLDMELRESFRVFVYGQIRQLGMPALLVTHDERDSCGGMIYHLRGEELE